MKTKITTTIILLAITGLSANAQTIPNGGFENWTTVTGTTTYDSAISWFSINPYFAGTGAFPVSKGTPGAVGSSYLNLTTRTIGTGLMPGFVVLGTPNYSTGRYDPIMQITNPPLSLNGQFQTSLNATDTAYIYVNFYKWNTTTMVSDVVGSSIKFFTGTVSSWTNFSIPITYFANYPPYTAPFPPDSATITMCSGNFNNTLNNSLYIDDLNFSGTATAGIQDLATENDIAIYPNPATAELKVISQKTKINKVTIHNILGELVLQPAFSEEQPTINVSSLPAGVYFIQLTDVNNNTVTKKIIKQ